MGKGSYGATLLGNCTILKGFLARRCGTKTITVVVVVAWALVFLVGGNRLEFWRIDMSHLSPNKSWSDIVNDFGTNYFGTRKSIIASTKKAPVKCKFPSLNPFDNKIKSYIRMHKTLDCSKNIPRIVDIVGEEIKIDPEKVKAKLRSRPIDFCRYKTLRMRTGDDFHAEAGDWYPSFKTSIKLNGTDESIRVDCLKNDTVVARSYHFLFRKKPEVEKKRQADYEKHVAFNSPKETLSLLMIGLDGMSRLNVIRTMKKTRAYLLRQFKAVEFKHFNKVGKNTFPCVLPIHTGLSEDEFYQEGWNPDIHFDTFDHLFLWHRYQKAGYRTAVQFDWGWITAFHYLKKGWKKPRFDYYPRPVLMASEADKVYRKSSSNCMGDTPEVSNKLDYWLQLTTLFNNTPSTPYFAYSFFSRLTHDDQMKASAGDRLYLRFFEELHRRNVMQNTVLMFFSDHGARFGGFRHTYNGVFEAKAPMLYIAFPPWFEEKYPELAHTFRNNADRLVTSFDLHETFKDLLTFRGKSRDVLPSARGISLLSEIPTNRTCQSAGIELKFCGCTSISTENLASSNVSKTLAGALLKEVVGRTSEERKKCVRLKLKETVGVYNMTPEGGLSKGEAVYHVTIRTTPGDALYEGTVLYDQTDKDCEIMGEVSRINMYRGQAECVDTNDLRPFCFCKKTSK